MSVKTGIQVFRKLIIDQLDLTVEVLDIIAFAGTEIVFKVCNLKWINAMQNFTGPGEIIWKVTKVDVENDVVYATGPIGATSLEYGNIIQIQKPTLWSGTPLSVNGEYHLMDDAGVPLTLPIVWLLESIPLSIPPKDASAAAKFKLKWFCLEIYDVYSHLNADRHTLCVFPMTQLGREILQVIDRGITVRREVDCESHELSRIGTETAKGFVSNRLDLNLSGTSYATTVIVDDNHYCKC